MNIGLSESGFVWVSVLNLVSLVNPVSVVGSYIEAMEVEFDPAHFTSSGHARAGYSPLLENVNVKFRPQR